MSSPRPGRNGQRLLQRFSLAWKPVAVDDGRVIEVGTEPQDRAQVAPFLATIRILSLTTTANHLSVLFELGCLTS